MTPMTTYGVIILGKTLDSDSVYMFLNPRLSGMSLPFLSITLLTHTTMDNLKNILSHFYNYWYEYIV